MEKQKYKSSGFTLLEILIVIAIIAVLAAMLLVSTPNAKNKARVNNTLTSLKGTLPIIVTCNDANDPVLAPANGNPPGGNQICNSASNSLWPPLEWGFSYVPIASTPGGNYGVNCIFEVNTNGSSAANIRCDCYRQVCE